MSRTTKRPVHAVRRAALLQLALSLLCVVSACSTRTPDWALTDVNPSRFSNDQQTTVTVTGRGFTDIPVVALSSGKKVELRQQYRVSLVEGSVTGFQTREVRRISNEQLELDVPADTRPGTYDVRVEPPLGAALVLPQALTIVSASAAADGGIDAGPSNLDTDASMHGGDASQSLAESFLSLEDAAGGAGMIFDPQKAYKPGTQLDLYAVVRDKAGVFKQDVTVSWTVTGVMDSQIPDGSSTRVTLDITNDVTITAKHETFGSVSVTVHVVPGPAVKLKLTPESQSLKAGDPALTFTVSAEDSAGNPTDDMGDLTFSLADGTLTGFDAAKATLTPRLIGSGHVLVRSSLGVDVTSGLIEVTPGPLATLIVSPNTLQLSADASPAEFTASGVDAFNNTAGSLGALTWTVASGPITTLSSAGLLDPVKAGTGTIRVSSSLGVSAVSGNITITAGHAAALSVTPSTWRGVVGGSTQQFAAMGSDADGNATTDLGTLTYSVTGPITAINATTGVVTPTTAGQGTVKATSSYAISGSTQTVLISSPSAIVTNTAMRTSYSFGQGATTRLELDFTTNDVADALLTGVAFTFADGNSNDTSANYTVQADTFNSDHVVPGSTLTQVYYVLSNPSVNYQGATYVTAKADAFNSAGSVVPVSRVGINSQVPATFGTGLSIDAPVPPGDRICAGGRVAFSASVTNGAFSFNWSFPGGTYAPGSSATIQEPSVDFAAVGVKSYTVTAAYNFFGIVYATTQPSTLMPVFVGTSSTTKTDQYPTGRVVFSSPTANQNLALSSFPRSDLITLDPKFPVLQCNKAAIDATGHNTLTVFSDRRLIDPNADTDASTPGIQVKLTSAGALPSVPLLAAATQSEGATTFYAEYFDAARGVTAGGDQTFNLTGDTQAPSVLLSYPASDCASSCLKTRDPIVFQFSEPLASTSPVLVDLFSGSSNCTASSSDWTSASTLKYEPTESALYVTTPTRLTYPYSVRVRLPATLKDTAATANTLTAQSRCAVFAALSDPAAPTTPKLIATPPSAFSPDGDQVSEVVTWNVSADAATTLLRLRIYRSGKAIWGTLVPVTQAGNFSLVWDGEDPNGRVVNNGAYAYTIEALNRAGTASTALRGAIEVSSAVRLVSLKRRQ